MARKRSSGRLIFVLLIIFLIYIGYKKGPDLVKLLYPLNYKESVIKYSKEYNLNPCLVAAVIKAESDFYVFAKSKKGAVGLMQITPSTGKWIAQKLDYEDYNKETLYNPDTNIRFGCWYLDYLSKHYDYNFKYVFCAYNGGEGNVDKWIAESRVSGDINNLDDVPYAETRKYVDEILRNYEIYKILYKDISKEGKRVEKSK